MEGRFLPARLRHKVEVLSVSWTGASVVGGDFYFSLEFLTEDLGRVDFFCVAMGLGGISLRVRMRLPLSAMIHSQVSPLTNSIAWAMLEGRLM
jgi:hypothetical protein